MVPKRPIANTQQAGQHTIENNKYNVPCCT